MAGDQDERFQLDGFGTVSVYALANVLLRRWRMILVLTALGSAVAVGVTMLFRKYVSVVSFYPDNGTSSMGTLTSLAAQFGFSLPTSSSAPGVDFYSALLESREFQTALLLHKYDFVTNGGDTVSGNLIDVFGIDDDDTRDAITDGLDKLGGLMSVGEDAAAGVVTVSVTTKWPQLSELLAAEVLAQVDTFNMSTRTSAAGAERRFVEGRMEVARTALTGAEDSLALFLERNHSISNSPQLQFEQERLQRRVDLEQDLYVSLAKAYENAKMEEVRDTPELTVIDGAPGSAEPAAKPSRRAAFGGIAGFMLGIGLAYYLAFLAETRRRHSGDYAEFRALRAGIADAVERPLRRIIDSKKS